MIFLFMKNKKIESKRKKFVYIGKKISESNNNDIIMSTEPNTVQLFPEH